MIARSRLAEVALDGGQLLRFAPVEDEAGRARIEARLFVSPRTKRGAELSVTVARLTPRQARALVDALEGLLLEEGL